MTRRCYSEPHFHLYRLSFDSICFGQGCKLALRIPIGLRVSAPQGRSNVLPSRFFEDL